MDQAQQQIYEGMLKAKVAQQQATQGGATNYFSANAPRDCAEPVQEPLSRRIQSRIARHDRETYKTDQLRELAYLLDKNPEVARILDLFEAVGRDV